MTTLSAPSGSMPPVEILAASSDPMEKAGDSPMGTAPLIVRYAGFASEAPKVSGRTDRISVHGGSRKIRKIDIRIDTHGENPSGGFIEGYVLGFDPGKVR